MHVLLAQAPHLGTSELIVIVLVNVAIGVLALRWYLRRWPAPREIMILAGVLAALTSTTAEATGFVCFLLAFVVKKLIERRRGRPMTDSENLTTGAVAAVLTALAALGR